MMTYAEAKMYLQLHKQAVRAGIEIQDFDDETVSLVVGENCGWKSVWYTDRYAAQAIADITEMAARPPEEVQ